MFACLTISSNNHDDRGHEYILKYMLTCFYIYTYLCQISFLRKKAGTIGVKFPENQDVRKLSKKELISLIKNRMRCLPTAVAEEKRKQNTLLVYISLRN